MTLLQLVISTIAIIASTKASGFGHFAAVKSFPVVRYAPFYNFPNTVRSIHAVASAAPVFAPAPAPLAAPALSAPVFPAPAFPAPVFAPPAFAPAFPAPAPLFPAPLSAPTYPVPAFAPALPAFSPAVPILPKLAPSYPVLPRIVPFIPGLPAAPFAPIVRPVAPGPVFSAPAPVFAPSPVFAPAPIVAPAPVAVPRVVPYPNNLHLYNRFIPAPGAPAPFYKQLAWK